MTDPPETAAASDARDHLTLVAEMSRNFAETRDINDALARGLFRIADKLDAEGASLFVHDPDTGDLVCRACTGPVDIVGLQLACDQGIVGRSVQSASPQLVADVANDPDFGGHIDDQTGFTTRSILAAPLRVQDDTLGAIELINKRGGAKFDMRDARLLNALAAAAGLALINARNAENMAAQAALQRELVLAATIQKRFLPERRTADFPIHGRNIPARDVSGDFFDIVEATGGRIWFCIGDVAGKGINASLMMVKTSSLFRYLAKTAGEPAQILAAINAELLETATHGLFVTMICGTYTPTTGEVAIANAGHEPALIYRRDTGACDSWCPAQTPPMGILPDLFGTTEPASETRRLGRDVIYLFTDGLTEAAMPDGTFLGAEGVGHEIARQEAIAMPPPACVDRLLTRIAPRHRSPADDLTLLRIADPAA